MLALCAFVGAAGTENEYGANGVLQNPSTTHWPLAELLNGLLDAGLSFDRFVESGSPVPIVLAVRAFIGAAASGERVSPRQ